MTEANIVHKRPKIVLFISRPTRHVDRPPLIAGNVVAKFTVGLGPPDTVTVDAPADAVAELFAVPPASRIVNRGEIAYIPPCVELMNKR